MMVGPILETKLFVPRSRPSLVTRPRLRERLNRGVDATLTLVSAPAGFGKTRLLTEWLAADRSDDQGVAWLSLDQNDNDPTSFWTYLIAALRTIDPTIGARSVSLLQSSQPQPIETLLTLLLNDLSTLTNDLVLVLDDYHVIETRDIQQGMTFLFDHMPPRLHLVMSTRADPPLPLARLRGRGELVEVRAADLRFTADEAASYLNEAMCLHLSRDQVAALAARTEGWIAGLQLAALSLQGRGDADSFVVGFAGDDRYVVDYLVEEVLQRQPESIRSFLLQTSILSRMSGQLCDAVTGRTGGKGTLEALDHGNLFVVPLDDQRRWYRYHHLFGDVLQAHLLHEQTEHVAELHRRASVWFEQNGERFEAIRHALAASWFERAADLIELAMPAMRRNRQEMTLLAWLSALPDDVIRVRPVLSNVFAGVLMQTGVFEGVDALLTSAEDWLDTSRRPDDSRTGRERMIIVDVDEFRRLPGSVAIHRAGHALVSGNVAESVIYAKQALDLILEDDDLGRGSASALLGLAAWTTGDLTAAHHAYTRGMANLRRAGFHADALGCAIALADICIAQGRLYDAQRTYEQALTATSELGAVALRGTADMYVGLSRLHRERNDIRSALYDLEQSSEAGENLSLPQNGYRWLVAMAEIRQANGEHDEAVKLLREAENRYVGDFFPNVRPIPALRARAAIAQGRLADALNWVRAQQVSVNDDLSYLREFDHITLARVLLAQHATEGNERALHDAIGLLERLLEAADAGGRVGSAIEILIVQTLAHRAQTGAAASLATLERALTLAEPQGYVRIFLDEGPPMAELLRAAVKRGIVEQYAHHLLAGYGDGPENRSVKQAHIEPLSDRELDVLRLLGTDLGGPEIARELFVSVNTMRSHTKNIYAKLGVNNRRAAVHRARELDLLSHPRRD